MSTPVLSSITPSMGPMSVGTSVSIVGSSLSDVTSITFGTNSVAVVPLSSSSIVCYTPTSLISGDVDVSATPGNVWAQNTSSSIVGITNFKCVSVSPTTGQYQLAAVDDGTLYISTNYGATWTVNTGTNLPSSGQWQSVAISDNGTYLTACEYTLGAYVSANSGGLWTQTYTASNVISVSMTANGQIQTLAQYNTTSVSVSTDYGSTWSSYVVYSYFALPWLCVAIN
jgi:hypothetical protein